MTSAVATHKDLQVWRRAMHLAESAYRLTAKLPSSEKFGLVSQMQRAAVSIPSNIAEGAARGSSAEFVRYLQIGLGSLAELETQVMLAQRLHLVEIDATILENIQVLRMMLINLSRSIGRRKR